MLKAQKAAERISTTARAVLLQRKCACGQHTIGGGDCTTCSKKREQPLQRSAIGREPADSHSNAAPPIVHEVLRSPGQPLDTATRAFFEPRFGHDFSRVRVHTDAQAAESAQAVNALAYTVDRHIVFGAGQYAPNTGAGELLLAHELTHAVQQTSSVQRIADRLQVTDAQDESEREAEAIAGAVIRDRPFEPISFSAPKKVARQPPGSSPTQNRPGCPNSIATVRQRPFSQPISNPGGGSFLVLGMVAEMAVGRNRAGAIDFAGTQIRERVDVGTNSCPIPVASVSGTGNFIVGSPNSVVPTNVILPGQRNIFYDNHVIPFESRHLPYLRTMNCSMTQAQTYWCGGRAVSAHMITRTFRPVASGDPNVITTKTDVSDCLSCPP